ncbi:MAG: hypothetical protein CMJ78_10400 [Planctomycetaceae bacterium]|nr:hypothetical protein [Planctomycetaceae bacterium]
MFQRLLILVCLLTPSVLAADDVRVIDVDGAKQLGELKAFDSTSIRVGDTPALNVDDVIAIDFDQPHRQQKSAARVILANGDELYLQIQNIDEDEMTAKWSELRDLPDVMIPLETIQGIIFRQATRRELAIKLLRSIVDHKKETDAITLLNGDQVSGEFQGLDADGVSLDSAVGVTQIKVTDIRLLAMNPELVSFPQAKGRRFVVQLTDGSQLTCSSLSLAAESKLEAKSAFGTSFQVPTSAIQRIRCVGGRAIDVSDLEPTQSKTASFLGGNGKAVRLDRNVLAAPLMLGGRRYSKGLGVQSRSELHFDLDGKFSAFRATIGIDDAAQGKGSVVFRILVDGKVAYESGLMTGKSAPVDVPAVKLEEAQTITLTVDYGEYGDILDYANWCDAILIRAK